MGRDRICKFARVLDLIDRDQNLRRNLFIEFNVLLKLADDGPGKRLKLAVLARLFLDHPCLSFKKGILFGEALDHRALTTLHQDFNGSIGKLQQLQYGRYGSHLKDVTCARIVLGCILLSNQKNLAVILHHVFEGANRFLAPDEQRDDHVWKHHDVSQW